MTLDDVAGAVRDYVLSVARQDARALERLFDASATIIGLDEGKFGSVPRDRWIAFVTSEARMGAGQEDFAILNVTIHETVGTAVVRTRFGAFDYTDVLSLVRVAGSVRIVGKVYHQHPHPN